MIECMRTTIRLQDQLLAEAKQLAARTGKTLTAVIEEALRESFARRVQDPQREPIRLNTFGGVLRPGVDLDSSAALLELMDRPDDAV